MPVTLTIDGHEIQTERATVAPHASGSVSFTQFTLTGANVRGSIKAGTDALPADNAFHFVLAPSDPVSLVIVDSGDRADGSLFLSKALAIGTTPAFQVDVTTASRMTPAAFDKRAVVILNDTMFPPAAGGNALKRYLEGGGGLLVVTGDHTTWPQGEAALLPGRLGATVDRTTGRSGSLGYLDYSHPVFEVFKAPRSGDFSAAHVFRYRTLQTEPDRPRPRAVRRWRDRGGGAEGRRRPRDRVDVDAGRFVDRHRREAGVPAARAPARALSRALRTVHVVVHGRPGARPDRARQRARRSVGPHRRDAVGRAHLARGRAARATKDCSS